RHDRIWLRLSARARDFRAREVRRARPPVGSRRPGLLRAGRRAAVFGQRSVSRAGSGLQTFGRDIPALAGTYIDQRAASAQPQAPGLGARDSARLRAAPGIRNLASGRAPPEISEIAPDRFTVGTSAALRAIRRRCATRAIVRLRASA